MAPEFEEFDALLINEAFQLVALADFGKPGHRNAEHGFHPVTNQ